MNKNSITVYRNVVEPTLLKRHEKVMAALRKLGNATVYELAEAMNTGVHNISGRLTELSSNKDYGKPLIESVGSRRNKYGNACTVWQPKVYQAEGEQASFF